MESSSTNIAGQSHCALHRIAALLEIIGVFIAGHTGASYVAKWLGLPALGPMLESALQDPRPDLAPLSWVLFQSLAVQYGCLLLLAFSIGLWHRRRTPARWGMSATGHSWLLLVGIGLLAFCLVALPFKVLWVVQQHVSLGAGSFWWGLLSKSWTPSFWLLFAVGSFALVPVIEELFFRGYCQTRLEEDWGGGGAIVIAALFFVFSHGQYHQASILSVATMLCLIPMALGLGYVFWRTRSLLPSVVMHAALNFPTKGIYDLVAPVAMLLVLILLRRRWWRWTLDFKRQIPGINPWATLAGLIFAVATVVGFLRWPRVFLLIGITSLVVALFMESRERRSVRRINKGGQGEG